MLEQKVMIQEGGRILIPASFRKELRVEPGEEVTLTLENGELKITSKYQALLRFRALVRQHVKHSDKSLVDELIGDRRREAKKEMRDD